MSTGNVKKLLGQNSFLFAVKGTPYCFIILINPKALRFQRIIDFLYLFCYYMTIALFYGGRTIMSYEIEIDFAPAYELVISLSAYFQKKYHKTMDLGKQWLSDVERQLTPEFRKDLSLLSPDNMDLLLAVIYHCPGERTPEQFLSWLEALSFEDLSEILRNYVKKLSVDLRISFHNHIYALRRWNEQYFSHIDPEILISLKKDSEIKKKELSRLSSEEVYESATRGIRLPESAAYNKVRLIPQYHLSPINDHYTFGTLNICLYACNSLPQNMGEPPVSLKRIARCLADETRLKLLQLISQKPRTFTELVDMTGISKSTIHHHMIALRGAGLIYLDIVDRNSIYTLRKEGIRELYMLLGQYLNIEEIQGEDRISNPF